MAAEPDYFCEDEVFRINKKGNIEFGMVLETTECFSSDDSSDIEEIPIKEGYVRVSWYPMGKVDVIPGKKVALSNRSFVPGDVVRRLIKGKDTQRGYCRNVHVEASVQIVGTTQVIVDVKSEDLAPISEFAVDIPVFMDSWVGIIRTVRSKLYLAFGDGSKCVINDSDASVFDELDVQNGKYCEFSRRYDYHPGQLLCGPVGSLEKGRWITCSKRMKVIRLKPQKRVKFIVDYIETESVSIHWQCQGYCPDDDLKEQPSSIIQGDNLKKLKMLNIFEACMLQVGDRLLYTCKEDDTYLTKAEWMKFQKNRMMYLWNRKKSQSTTKFTDNIPKTPKDPQKYSPPVSQTLIPCLNDVKNDSGSHSSGSSVSGRKKKPPKLMTKVLKFKKLRRARRKLPEIEVKPDRIAVVETVFTTSKADVVWQDGTVEEGIPCTDLYPIHYLDEQEFFPGDFVLENNHGDLMVYGVVQSVDHTERVAVVNWFHTYATEPLEPTLLHQNEISVYDLKDHPDFQYQPGTIAIRVANFEGEGRTCTAGQVLDNYPDGRVHVWWVTGRVSMCWPQDLYNVTEYDTDDEIWKLASTEGSWVTESEGCLLDDTTKPKLAANIEKARIAMSRLEELFTQNVGFRNAWIAKELLEAYNSCRYLDKLIGSSFFDKKHFQGLLERVHADAVSSKNWITTGDSDINVRVAFSETIEPIIEEKDDRLTKSMMEPKEIYINLKKDVGSCVIDKLNVLGEQKLTEVDYENSPDSIGTGKSLSRHSTSKPRVEFYMKNLDMNRISSTRSLDYQTEKRGSKFKTSSQISVMPSHRKERFGGNIAEVCARLCALIKIQLLKALAEVTNPDTTDEAKEVGNVEGSTDELETVDGLDTGNKEADKTNGGFTIVNSVSGEHKFKELVCEMVDPKAYIKTIRREIQLLRHSLPSGVWVKCFEDRMDLMSVMIRGPAKTPYEDGLFLFDFHLPGDYPRSPPLCHYYSYCSDRLNPNLYEDGKVCVSLLGTWSGKGTEIWSLNSNLLQVLVSIQGLILVSEPYFNEADYERQKNTQQGLENSRMYNEMAVLKLVQAMTKLLTFPHEIFKEEIQQHFNTHAEAFITRLERWLDISENTPTDVPTASGSHKEDYPEFPLLPASKGFCLTLKKSLVAFKNVLLTISSQ